MIDWLATKRSDVVLVRAVMLRVSALELTKERRWDECTMDLQAAAITGQTDLVKLLDFDDGDFTHDVLGIWYYIDRETGQMRDCFLPRSAPAADPKIWYSICREDVESVIREKGYKLEDFSEEDLESVEHMAGNALDWSDVVGIAVAEVADEKGIKKSFVKVRCDQCQMLSINGVPCHETGCPNQGARWDVDSGEWVKQYRCHECGYLHDIGEECVKDESGFQPAITE